MANSVLRIVFLAVNILTVVGSFRLIQIRPGVFMSIKFFGWGPKNGTVSKFPPIIEYFVERIQTHNSNFVHEDLSRPPTWEKPVYTLSPEEQLTANQPLVTESVTQQMQPLMQDVTESKATSTTDSAFEYEELEETTEKFFEIIGEDEKKNFTSSYRDTYSSINQIDTNLPFSDKFIVTIIGDGFRNSSAAEDPYADARVPLSKND